MSFAPLPLLPAHLTRQDSRTLTTAGGHRRHPRSAVLTDNKVWRVVTTDGGEAENNDEEDGPSTAIQRGNSIQVPLEKLLKPPGAPSSKPPSQWKASPPTGLTLEELRRRASGQQAKREAKEAHTFRQEEPIPPRTPARGHVVFAPHVKIASGPPRSQAPAATTAAAASAEVETVAHDLVTIATSTAPSSNQPPPNRKAKATATCRPTSATGRLRHVASKLRPTTAPDAPGQNNAFCASSPLNYAQPKEAKGRPKTDPNSPPQHGSAPQSQSRPPITYCPASGNEPGFPDGYIIGRLHPDGPFGSSSSNRTPSTPSAASTPQALATEDLIFRPARPQELPRVQGRFYEGTLILVREPESHSAEGEGEGQAPAQQQEDECVGTAALKRGLASKVKHRVGKLMADAADAVVETQWPPPQRRVVVASAAAAAARGRGRARTSVTLPAGKPRGGAQTGKKKGHEGSKQPGSASKSKRKAPPPPPSPPSIPARSSSADLARPTEEDPPQFTSASLKSSSSQVGGIVRHASGDLRACREQDEVTPDNELDTLPIILWSGWASCSSSASSGCSTPSSSSCSSTVSHVAPQAPPSPSRRSAFDRPRAQQQHQQGADGKAMGKSSASLNPVKGARAGNAAAGSPGSTALLPGLGGAVRLAVKRVASSRRPVTPAPVVAAPPPLRSAAEKRSGEATEDQSGGGRSALDLPARDDISVVEPSPAQKLVTPKGSLARASREPGYRKHAQQQHRREVRIVVWPRSTSQAGPRSRSRATLGAAAAQHGQEHQLEEPGEGEGLDSRLAEEDDEAAKSNGAAVCGSELRSILL